MPNNDYTELVGYLKVISGMIGGVCVAIVTAITKFFGLHRRVSEIEKKIKTVPDDKIVTEEVCKLRNDSVCQKVETVEKINQQQMKFMEKNFDELKDLIKSGRV